MDTFKNSNMEAAVNFLAEMIIKYGDIVLAEIKTEKKNSN